MRPPTYCGVVTDDSAPITWADGTLTAVIIIVGVYAAGLVLIGGFVGDELFGPLGFGPESAGITGGAERDYTTFIFGVLGAVIIGWMVLTLVVARGPLRCRERWAWNAVASSIGLWFLVDTGFSLGVGQIEHAIFNLAFLAAVAVPLARLRREVTAPI